MTDMATDVTSGVTSVSNRVEGLYLSERLAWVIIGLGVALRLLFYGANKALFIDEAAVALNIVERSFSALREPLDYFQGAPYGWLVLEKLVITLLGNTEYALRLLPLASGIASLFLFYAVAKHYLSPRAVPLTLALFAFTWPLIRFSTMVKPYSSDVAVSLALLLLTTYVYRKGLTVRWLLAYALVGASFVWLSYPSVMVLAGLGGTLGLHCALTRQWGKLSQLLVVYGVWLLSFGASFMGTAVRALSNESGYATHFSSRFMPLPPTSLSDFRWYYDTFLKIFDNPVGMSLMGIAALAFIIGAAEMYRTRRYEFVLLLMPLVVTLLVAASQTYPFTGRFILFLVPGLLLFIGEGVESVRVSSRRSHPAAGHAMLALVLVPVLLTAGFHIVNSRTEEEIDEVMDYVSASRSEGDLVYVYHGAVMGFAYYAESFGFAPEDYQVGVNSTRDLQGYVDDLDTVRGNDRVWVIFSHVTEGGVGEKKFFLNYLDGIGSRLDSVNSPGASGYLYDLS